MSDPVTATIAAGLASGAATGAISAMNQPPAPKDQRLSMPGANPSAVGARPAGVSPSLGRMNIDPQQRPSLAAQMLSRSGGYA